jgi:hypothetical protein
MRGLKSTIALVLVLAGLGAYIYFVTWKQPEGGDAASKQEKVFAGLETDKVDEVKVKSEKGDTTTVKENGAWQVTAPVATKADESGDRITIISARSPSCASSTRIRGPEGAASATRRDQLAGGGDVDYRKLHVGDKAPRRRLRRRNDEKSVLIPAQRRVQQDTFQLRDKTI